MKTDWKDAPEWATHYIQCKSGESRWVEIDRYGEIVESQEITQSDSDHIPDVGKMIDEKNALNTLLYVVERAVRKGNANYDIEDAYEEYEAKLKELNA